MIDGMEPYIKDKLDENKVKKETTPNMRRIWGSQKSTKSAKYSVEGGGGGSTTSKLI